MLPKPRAVIALLQIITMENSDYNTFKGKAASLTTATWLEVFVDVGFGISLFAAANIFVDGFSLEKGVAFSFIALLLFWYWSRLSLYTAYRQQNDLGLWIPAVIALFGMLMFASSVRYVVRLQLGFPTFWAMVMLLVLLFLWSQLARQKGSQAPVLRGHFLSYLVGFLLLLISIRFPFSVAVVILWSSALVILLVSPLVVWFANGMPSTPSSDTLVAKHNRMITFLLILGVAAITPILSTVYYAVEIANAIVGFGIIALLWRTVAGVVRELREEANTTLLSNAYFFIYPPLVATLLGLCYGMLFSFQNCYTAGNHVVIGGNLLFIGIAGLLILLGIASLFWAARQNLLLGLARIVGGIVAIIMLCFAKNYCFNAAIYIVFAILCVTVMLERVICILTRSK